MTPLHLMIES